MVLKKTNCCQVNSGNTMKRRSYRQQFQRFASQTNHVIKSLINFRPLSPSDGSENEIDKARLYFDDGSLAHTHVQSGWIRMVLKEIYSMNKKKRWLLEDVVADAVKDEKLAQEQFKVTLVRRVVPCDGRVTSLNSSCNVTRYYDSHNVMSMVTSNKAYSTRQGLLQKANQKQNEKPEQENLHQRKRRQGHNQHFRGIQRKRPRNSVKDPAIVRTREELTVPEIRYEIAEAQQLTSSNFKSQSKGCYDPYYDSKCGTRFRGPRRQRLSWYCFDSVCTQTTKKKCPQNLSGADDIDHFEEDESVQLIWDDDLYSHSSQQEFSLLDLLSTTQWKKSHKPKKRPCMAAHVPEIALVNSASHQQVRKFGKGLAIYVEKELEEEITSEIDKFRNPFMRTTEETDTYDDSGVQSGDETDSSLKEYAIDYEKEITNFNKSLCSCRILNSEFNSAHIQETFGPAAVFGSCIPLTVKFDLYAVALLFNKDIKESVDMNSSEWWLVCQAGQRLWDQPDSSQFSEKDVIVVKLKLHGCSDVSDIERANLRLHCVISNFSQSAYLPIYTLLFSICDMLLGQQSILSSSAKQSSHSPKAMDIYLPHELYVAQVAVCSVDQAYKHLTSAEQLSTQMSEENLSTSSSFTWYDVMCSVCFTYFDDERVSEEGFCTFVALRDCGHGFCRRCWQHHLLSRVLEGQTTLYCMEYRCKVTVDCTMLVSLVPQRVYICWQQRLQNNAVESSGEWKWCPNVHCGRLAKLQETKTDNKSGKGIPVVCACQNHWCLNCGEDAHWPITCLQSKSYQKMLKQYGEEEGQKTSATVISFVQVKRCPGCSYPLEKNGGCSHMICSRCSKNFCWVCLVDWSVHAYGDWNSCREKAEETVELDNDKVYPLPIECYKKAVSYRYIWKQLDKDRHRTISAYHHTCVLLKSQQKILVATVSDDAVDHVTYALLFLRKAHILLELSYILLSNTPRHHCMVKQLRTNLQLLEFITERVNQHLQRPVKRVLMISQTLQKTVLLGHRQLHQVCRQTHHLTSNVHDSESQDWLLNADHERFVRYK